MCDSVFFFFFFSNTCFCHHKHDWTCHWSKTFIVSPMGVTPSTILSSSQWETHLIHLVNPPFMKLRTNYIGFVFSPHKDIFITHMILSDLCIFVSVSVPYKRITWLLIIYDDLSNEPRASSGMKTPQRPLLWKLWLIHNWNSVTFTFARWEQDADWTKLCKPPLGGKMVFCSHGAHSCTLETDK